MLDAHVRQAGASARARSSAAARSPGQRRLGASIRSPVVGCVERERVPAWRNCRLRARGRRGRRTPGRRTTGSPIASRWTRIWWVRPVSSRASQERPAHRAARATSNHVTASRGVSLSIDRRVRSARSRPIGASIRPVLERGAPRTSARYLRSTRRSRIASAAARAPPPTGRRPADRTCHGRADGRCPAAPGRRPQRRGRPGAGRASRRVTGSGMHDEPGRLVDHEEVARPRTPRRAAGLDGSIARASGISTSSSSPPSRRWLFERRCPSTSTAPLRTSLSASVRVPTPGTSATTASRRRPASVSETRER